MCRQVLSSLSLFRLEIDLSAYLDLKIYHLLYTALCALSSLVQLSAWLKTLLSVILEKCQGFHCMTHGYSRFSFACGLGVKKMDDLSRTNS